MDSNLSYTWESMKGGGYKSEPVMKRYGWWISLALLFSALIHVVLFLAAEKMPSMFKFFPGKQDIVQLNADRDTLAIDEETLRELWDEEQPVPEPIKESPRDQLLAEEQIFEEEPEIELATIKLTPEVTEMQNYLAGERAVAPKAVDIPAITDKIEVDFSTETNANEVKQQLLEASRASVDQPTITLSESDIPQGIDTDAVVKELTSKLGASEGKRITDRFTPLEDLLGSGGQMPDNPKFMLPTDLLFGLAEWELKEAARLSLMKLGVVIVHYPKATFRIKGFTDSIGSDAYNLELSQKRADSVRTWVVDSLGLDGFRIEAVGVGRRDFLVEPTGDPEEESLNRRVEIEIINKPAAVPQS
ncbi:MAG: OOP family OmpA-OmpF porin [Verrucomicrobiales bacterium]|jgi:OOP family OmpA-OmpF porin